MPVGIIKIDLYLSNIRSLKEKRHYIKPLINDVEKKFHASVAETGKQDIWKNSQILVAIASSDAVQIERIKQRLMDFLENHWAEIYITNYEMEIIFE